jgi:hypothetical protein
MCVDVLDTISKHVARHGQLDTLINLCRLFNRFKTSELSLNAVCGIIQSHHDSMRDAFSEGDEPLPVDHFAKMLLC